MNKKKRFQVLELSYGKICSSCGLMALFSENSHSNMRLENHIYIISSVTNSQCCLIFESRFDHLHNICLLLWRYPAGKYNINFVWALKKRLEYFGITFNFCENGAWYNYSMLTHLFSLFLIFNRQRYLPEILLKPLLNLIILQHMHLHI